MGLVEVAKKIGFPQETEILNQTNDTEVLKEWGVEQAPLGLDCSSLLLALYSIAINEFSGYNTRREDLAVETYHFPERGEDWIHSHFNLGKPIEIHLFGIHVGKGYVKANLSTTKSEGKAKSEVQRRIKETPSIEQVSTKHLEDLEGIFWPVGSLTEHGPLKTGQFTVQPIGNLRPNEIVGYIGARVFEMMRYVQREIRQNRRYHTNIQFNFSNWVHNSNFNISLEGGPKIACGFEDGGGTIKVAYVALAGETEHKECQFDHIQKCFKQYFPE